MKFQKTVVVDAVQWQGGNLDEAKAFLGDHFVRVSGGSIVVTVAPSSAVVGVVGDWLVNEGGVFRVVPGPSFVKKYTAVLA